MSAGTATAPAASLQVTELAIADLSPAHLAAWRRLADEAADPNPFFEPEFIVPAAELLPGAPDRLLAVTDGERWLACLPVGPARVRFATRVVSAGEINYGFLATPLIAGERSAEAADLLVDAIAERTGAPLAVQRLATAGPFFEALERGLARGALRQVEREDFERAMLTADAGDDPTAHLRPHHRRELRRVGRRLEEALGGTLRCEDRAGDPAAVERFLEVEAAGWKGREGTAMGSDERSAEFLRRVCAGFHALGRLQLLVLGSETEIAAVKLNLGSGSGSFAFKIAFDERFHSYSPGVQLEVENAARFPATGLEWMDSCAIPTNSMINRLWRGRRRLCTGVFASPRMRAARASLALTRGMRTLKRNATGGESSSG